MLPSSHLQSPFSSTLKELTSISAKTNDNGLTIPPKTQSSKQKRQAQRKRRREGSGNSLLNPEMKSGSTETEKLEGECPPRRRWPCTGLKRTIALSSFSGAGGGADSAGNSSITGPPLRSRRIPGSDWRYGIAISGSSSSIMGGNSASYRTHAHTRIRGEVSAKKRRTIAQNRWTDRPIESAREREGGRELPVGESSWRGKKGRSRRSRR